MARRSPHAATAGMSCRTCTFRTWCSLPIPQLDGFTRPTAAALAWCHTRPPYQEDGSRPGCERQIAYPGRRGRVISPPMPVNRSLADLNVPVGRSTTGSRCATGTEPLSRWHDGVVMTNGPRVIGMLGGMSWESSAQYYRLANELVRERLGGLHSARVLLASVDFAEIEQLQTSGRWDEAGQLLAEAANPKMKVTTAPWTAGRAVRWAVEDLHRWFRRQVRE